MDNPVPAFLRRARELYDSGLLVEAEELLRGKGVEGADDAGVLSFRAYLLYKLGRFEEAEPLYRRLCEVSPDDPSHVMNLGRICLKQSKLWKAKEAFEKVLKIRPGDEKAMEKIDLCLERLGPGAGRFALAATEGGISLPRENRRKERGGAGEFLEWLESTAAGDRDGEGGASLHAGRTSITFRVEEKLYFSSSHLLSCQGALVFSPSTSDARRMARRFAAPGREMVRAEGNGEILLGGEGGRLLLFGGVGAGRRACVNFQALVAHGPGISASPDVSRSMKGTFLMTTLSGEGLFALAVGGAPVFLNVTEGSPVSVRVDAVVAWTDGLACELEPPPHSVGGAGRRGRKSFVQFEGKGSVLLQENPVGGA